MTNTIFNLKIQKFREICIFELSWGGGQRLTAEIDYPPSLSQLYQNWQRAYFNFYQSEEMRGRTVGGGVLIPVVDWHAELVKAETKLMYQFHRWLKSAELYDIRQQITQANLETTQTLQLFLTCATIELERFPWEAWEIGKGIQIIRAPVNIAAATVNHQQIKRPTRPRILAILGDDTGLNFQEDKQAVKSLLPIAQVEFVGWQPEQTPTQVIQQISDAIADQKGWDVLFFAGHSNEMEMTGGELGIAPGVSISIREITPQLSLAKQRGLQVAIFNSCSGINIAQSLIDLGFSQVVVMREPIHNRVAQEFLVQFLQGLGKHQDVYESVIAARQFLQLQKSHSYPSSYLVPSLFCHPGGELYRIPAGKWKQRLRQSIPTLVEAIALTASLTLSTIVPIQDLLLDGRMFSQAVYRNRTAQIPSSETPPVLIVQIDTESIYRAKLPTPQLMPINRSYIAQLLHRLRILNASVIGINFIFDTPQEKPPFADQDLGKAVRQAVDANMWLIFGAVLKPDREVGTNEALGITNWNWTLQAYLNSYPQFVELPDPQGDCRHACPFAYLISLVQTANQEITDLPQPHTKRVTNLRTQFFDVIDKHQNQGNLSNISQWRSPFGLQPLVDFSIPPAQVYTKIPAWKLIENPNINEFPLLSQQVVLIAVSSDERLGIAPGLPDRLPSPFATHYWTQQNWLTGGESLAYMTHHFLTRRMVIPIPDFWMIGMAAILGKITVYLLQKKSKLSHVKIIIGSLGAVILYGIVGLQLYISAAVLLPWLLPSAVFLAYVLPTTRKKHHP
ncbi:MAG: CHASE2 domain-containing protein [Nostocaceae cyanobacterium]|nr:CHASE2 domain-containing protein [Nostocaceae cyanobacterium]